MSQTSHPHTHHHAGSSRAGNRRRLAVTLGLTLTYMFAELLGAWLTNSLALLADAGHMLSDAAALVLSLFALWVASRPPSPSRTYGYFRTEILAALANGALLVALAVLIAREAIERVNSSPPLHGGWLMIIAAGGLLVNIAGMLVLHGGRNESLNVRGAFMHVASDALGSVQVLLAGFAIELFGWHWVDPVASLIIAGLIVISAWGLLRESLAVLMEGVPGHLDIDAVRNAIMAVPEVKALHDLHVWTITSGFVALSAHVQVEARASDDILWRIHEALHHGFGIQHTTIQIELPPPPARLGPPGRQARVES